jgi:alkylation response protein AidB-like acyl-CoA dehydrogenase
MDLSFTTDQLMVRNMAKEFATKELEPKAAEIDEKGEFPHEAIKKMAELGMLSMTIPEKYGGAAFDFTALAIAIEEISRACGSTGVITAVHNSLACWPIVNWGTDAQKEKYLPRMATGELLGAFGLTEPNAGSDPGAMETTAVLKGDKYILNGSKRFITNGGVAKVFIVFAKTDPAVGTKGITCFIVDRDAKGTRTCSGCAAPPTANSSSTTAKCRPKTSSAASARASKSRSAPSTSRALTLGPRRSASPRQRWKRRLPTLKSASSSASRFASSR